MFELFRDLIFHRSSWRRVSFSELSELYASLLLRSMALSLIGIFVPVYLYQLGFSIAQIAVYFMIMYGSRMYLDPWIGRCLRRLGPKYMIRLSHFGLIIHLALLLAMKYYSVPLAVVALSQALPTGAFYLSLDLDFSKLKNVLREGKELGSAFVWQKIGAIMGPITGGLVASFYGIQFTIMAAIIILFLASIPLFLSPETVHPTKYERFRYSDLDLFKRDFWVSFGYGLQEVGAMLIWPLFISITVFRDNVYANLGLITTIGLFMSVLVARFFGQVIDDKKGSNLLNWSSVVTGFSMFVRPFIDTFVGVLTVGFVFEGISSGIVMPYNKGIYDTSDRVGRMRLSYLTSMLMYMHVSRFLIWFLIWAFAIFVNDISALEMAFVAAGLGTLLITTQRFEALK